MPNGTNGKSGHSNGGRYRSPDEIAIHRMTIAERTLRGEGTQREIAQDLGLSQAQVSKDLTAVRRDWEARKNDAIDRLKAEKIAHWELIIQSAWASFDLSKQPREKTSQKMVEATPNPNNNTTGSKVQSRSEGVVSIEETPEGDPRFLFVLTHALEKQQEIQGIKPPEMVNVNHTSTFAALMKKAKQVKEEKVRLGLVSGSTQ